MVPFVLKEITGNLIYNCLLSFFLKNVSILHFYFQKKTTKHKNLLESYFNFVKKILKNISSASVDLLLEQILMVGSFFCKNHFRMKFYKFRNLIDFFSLYLSLNVSIRKHTWNGRNLIQIFIDKLPVVRLSIKTYNWKKTCNFYKHTFDKINKLNRAQNKFYKKLYYCSKKQTNKAPGFEDFCKIKF